MNTPSHQHLTILTGASRGMGLAMAHRLLASDHLLLCISRQSAPGLETAAREIGAPLIQWQQDLRDPEAAAHRLQKWLETQAFQSLRSATLINNAGVVASIGPLETATSAEIATALRVGLEAPMALTAAFLRATRAWVDNGWRGQRKVLNISSGLGRRAMAAQATYCAAKAGMDHFSRCCALDEAQHPQGAKIVSLAPGVIDTDMQTRLRAGDPALFPDHSRFVDLKEHGQLTSTSDAAQAVLAWLERPDFGDQPVADVRD